MQHQNVWSVKSYDSFSSSLKGILTVRDRLIVLAGNIPNAKVLLNSSYSNGKFSVKAAYGYLRGGVLAGCWTKGLVHPRIVPSHRIVCSLAVLKQLATVDNLQHRGFHVVVRCSLCEAALEDHNHLFFTCPFPSVVWEQILNWMGLL
ncbi:uncharacterized protein LOC141630727 [Silene latifolia]|uniref:uncharacterized protein LOC141630727 n=1 Tax=Silene latifolia TaxID=37657 RepID=UPI003D76B4A9